MTGSKWEGLFEGDIIKITKGQMINKLDSLIQEGEGVEEPDIFYIIKSGYFE